jgi:hypothetical protein
MGMIEAVSTHAIMRVMDVLNLEEKSAEKSLKRVADPAALKPCSKGACTPAAGTNSAVTSFLVDIPLLSATWYWWEDKGKVDNTDITSATYG